MTTINPIARLNDQFRSLVGLQRFDAGIPGSVFCTPGISALPPEQQIAIWFAVAQFNDFSEDNDPYGEHDFGAFDAEGAGKAFWKIDYYADADMDRGSEDPADPQRSFRVLTIMPASEY